MKDCYRFGGGYIRTLHPVISQTTIKRSEDALRTCPWWGFVVGASKKCSAKKRTAREVTYEYRKRGYK